MYVLFLTICSFFMFLTFCSFFTTFLSQVSLFSLVSVVSVVYVVYVVYVNSYTTIYVQVLLYYIVLLFLKNITKNCNELCMPTCCLMMYNCVCIQYTGQCVLCTLQLKGLETEYKVNSFIME